MLIMHIGRQKTGTTSIQAFLDANREALTAHGVNYPQPMGAPMAHHGLALAMGRNDDLTPYRDLLLEAGVREKPVLLSSEGFQRRAIAGRAKELANSLRTDLQAVVYLREQFSYAWAAYAQAVRVRFETRSFEERLAQYSPNYVKFLSSWQEATGGNLKVRIFQRPQLLDGDVVSDFCRVIGLDKSQFRPITVRNETPGWRVINFIRQINGHLAKAPAAPRLKRSLNAAIRLLASEYPDLMEKPVFPINLVKQYQAKFVQINKQVSQNFFTGQPLFDLAWHGDSTYNSHETLTAVQLEALYEREPKLRALCDDIQPAKRVSVGR